ncbi:MAG: hypothetical protein ABJF01_11925 [bacterium]
MNVLHNTLHNTTSLRRVGPVSGLVAMLLLVGCSSPVVTTAAPAPAQTSPAATTNRPPVPANDVHALPSRLSDADYWKLETDISEPGGYFQIEDNYTSNEMEVGQLFSMLRNTGVNGGVYMGVGPEQNLTYIAAVRPKMAFIVDIRRQAVMQHLMFKAMFEMAPDRADFVSILFAKRRPPGIDSTTTIQKIWTAYRASATDSALARQNYARILERLTKTHGFAFTPEETAQLKAVFDAFYYYGPAISTRGAPSGRGGDFAELTGFSTDTTGEPRSFLSSEDNYRYVKSLHDRNLIVPVSGDFAGPKAIRAIGSYLTAHDGIVSAFYVSNVEQYLFSPNRKDGAFYSNVATLPVNPASVFIRPYSMRRGGGGPTRSLCPIAAFIRAAEAGRVLDNNAALACVP